MKPQQLKLAKITKRNGEMMLNASSEKNAHVHSTNYPQKNGYT
jgi:hypothetical protein